MQVNSYLMFEGRCDEALEFYTSRLGAKVKTVMRFKDMPTMSCPSGAAMMPPVPPEKVMHAEFWLGETMMMASDGHCSGKPQFAGVWLTLSVWSEADADAAFAALADGGQIRMPIGKTFFSPRYGMVTDRFGVEWTVIVPAQAAA